MKKLLLLGLITSIFAALPILSVYAQEDMVVIEDDGILKRQRPAAVFKHDDHNETAEIEDCIECHHVYEDGQKLEDESSEDQLCSDCHSEGASDDRPHLVKAFHLNCKGCHLQNKKGPIMCGECHVR